MSNKTVIRTYTKDTPDGAIATYSERIEEREDSGIKEVGIGLVLLTACLILTLFSWAIATSIVNYTHTETNEKNHQSYR